jgi:hypothetical protein
MRHKKTEPAACPSDAKGRYRSVGIWRGRRNQTGPRIFPTNHPLASLRKGTCPVHLERRRAETRQSISPVAFRPSQREPDIWDNVHSNMFHQCGGPKDVRIPALRDESQPDRYSLGAKPSNNLREHSFRGIRKTSNSPVLRSVVTMQRFSIPKSHGLFGRLAAVHLAHEMPGTCKGLIAVSEWRAGEFVNTSGPKLIYAVG